MRPAPDRAHLKVVQPPPPVLSFEDVWVEYGETVVLERLSLQVAPESFVSIVGPSGVGKSTLLRLVTGMEAPTRGRVLMDGGPVNAEPGPARGAIFHKGSVFPHMTALDNVAFGLDCAGAPLLGRLFGARRKAAVEQAELMLARAGLKDARGLYPAQMTPGMRQQLALAQALIRRPRVLVLDDPLGGLDPEVRQDLHELIADLWPGRELTVLMVTRDIKEAFRLGTRVLALDKRRRDPQAPGRFGATAVYDFVLDRKSPLGVLSEMEAVQEMVDPSPFAEEWPVLTP
jgi:NitT/TauT family transport system ATP-binding protein